MPKLPTGQRRVPNWPVLDLGDAPDVPLDAWRLEVSGLCDNPLSFDLGRVPGPAAGGRRERLPLRDDVEPDGQPLARRAVPHARRTGRARGPTRGSCRARATTTCRASSIPYTTNLPLARAVEDDVLLVHTWEGEPLPREHGGPCRMITPKLYAWKGTKWIRRIEFLARQSARLLGSARLLEHGRAVARRPVLVLTARDVFRAASDRVQCPRPATDAGHLARGAAAAGRSRAWSTNPSTTASAPSCSWSPAPRRASACGRATATRSRSSSPTSSPRSRRGAARCRARRARRRNRGARRRGPRGRIPAAAAPDPRLRARLPIVGAHRTPDEQPAAFVAFDLLRDGDHDLRARPLRERRARARSAAATPWGRRCCA